MKSYIQHLGECQGSVVRGDDELCTSNEPRLNREKRRVMVRSMSDPLLPQFEEAGKIRRGRKRPNKRPIVQRSNSFDGEFGTVSSCSVNACQPQRRRSIGKKTTVEASEPRVQTTLKSAMQAQYNAMRPTRRNSMEKTKSCPDLSPRKARRQISKENMKFRAKILCNALKDMGLFDDDDEDGDRSDSMPFAPILSVA